MVIRGSIFRRPGSSGRFLFAPPVVRYGFDRNPKGEGSGTELVTIDRARTDIDFIDHTTRALTVFVQDSGGYKMPGRGVIISGDNGQTEGISDDQYGKFVAVLPPGNYTVTVPGADPETEEVDVTGGDQTVTMTIPVKIELSIGPRPKLFDIPDEFLEQFSLKPEDNPEGYMYYYPPEPRTHTYTVTATANGNPVEDFTLFATDEVSMMTEDPPAAAPKRVTFRAEKEGYLDSDPADDMVTVLGDVPVGSAAKIVSVPVVNYTVLHDPPGDSSYSYFDDSMTLKGMVSDMQIEINDTTIPVYPSPWRDERTIEDFPFEKSPGSEQNIRTWKTRDYSTTNLLLICRRPLNGWLLLKWQEVAL